nr:MAG TPA: hypothetical protein [Caudoviricetes sp.]
MCIIRKSGGNVISFYIDRRAGIFALYFIILFLKIIFPFFLQYVILCECI